MIVYFDWNVFNQLEKLDNLDDKEKQLYTLILRGILNNKITCPYSNAHLNDLIRGYRKNPDYIKGHLDILEKLTNNLCVCQYWEQTQPSWHIRSVKEFFNTAIDDPDLPWDSFEELVDDRFELEEEIVVSPLALLKPILEMKKVPELFKKIYNSDPIFSIIYPQTRMKMTEYALCCDIYNFSLLLNRDYSLYKAFRKFLLQTINSYKTNVPMVKCVNSIISTSPRYLSFDELFDAVEINQSIGSKSAYDNFFNIFFRFDLKGYKSDSKFSNMMDDALHSYYGSYCNYFVTNDDRCKYKAENTYQRLNISTKVLTPQEFSSILS